MDCYKIVRAATVLVLAGVCMGEFVLPQGPLNGALGGKVQFFTTLSPPSKPFLSISWTFNELNIITSTSVNTIDPGYTNRISLNRDTGSLELRSLVLADSGEYALVVILDGGTRMQGAVTLNVYALISGATITSPTATLIEDKSSVSLTCDALGSISTRDWMKDGQPLYSSGRVTFTMDNRTVNISPVHGTNHGIYLCRVSNPVSSMTVEYNLTVNFGPRNVSISGPRAPPMGHRVTLHCTADSIPAATFRWMFNSNATVVNSSLYVIEKMEEANTGNYTCIANNMLTMLENSTVISLRAGCVAPCWTYAVLAAGVLLTSG